MHLQALHKRRRTSPTLNVSGCAPAVVRRDRYCPRVCTVVVRWSPQQPVRVLALRDELVGRDFDDPGRWWPDQPDAVGGCDRTAGGSWCVSDVPSGRTALVLNRPERPEALEGAPSRGVLPLLAVQHGRVWPGAVDLTGMASFNLVLASPESLTCWSYDGQHLLREDREAGTHMVTSGGAEDGKAGRYLRSFAEAAFPAGWRELLRAELPADDPAALVVRAARGDRVFATVFGQVITSVPTELSLAWSRRPWGEGPWAAQVWTAPQVDLRA